MGQQVLNPRPSALHACVLPFTTALASHKGSFIKVQTWAGKGQRT